MTERLVHRPLSRLERALLGEAAGKSDVVWIRPVEQSRTHAVWHVWHENAVVVLDGPGEQSLPELTPVVEIIVPSKETRAALITFHAVPEVLQNATERWQAAADVLAAARLNSPDMAGQLHRWRVEARITSFRPVAVVSAVSGDDGTPVGLLPPLGGGGTTLTRRPFHFGRRRRRAERLGH